MSANVQEVVEKDLQTPSRYAFTAAQVHSLFVFQLILAGILCAENVDWVGRVGMPSKSSLTYLPDSQHQAPRGRFY